MSILKALAKRLAGKKAAQLDLPAQAPQRRNPFAPQGVNPVSGKPEDSFAGDPEGPMLGFEDDESGPAAEDLEPDELLDFYMDANDVHRFEGGTSSLERVVEGLGYESLDEFFADNSGAQEAIVEWIRGWVPKAPSWIESLRAKVPSAND